VTPTTPASRGAASCPTGADEKSGKIDHENWMTIAATTKPQHAIRILPAVWRRRNAYLSFLTNGS
jgi:hypothetical protein